MKYLVVIRASPRASPQANSTRHTSVDCTHTIYIFFNKSTSFLFESFQKNGISRL